jgi:HAD superfamily hydrolase (TIGR01509 family)
VSIAGVVFDMDGVLIDSEQVWDDIRRKYVVEQRVEWKPEYTRAMMGMSSLEWPVFLADEVGVSRPPDVINKEVVDRLVDSYKSHVPVLPGAVEAVGRLAAEFPLALASSSNRSLIDLVLEQLDLTAAFVATVSSEEVPHGKPSPDVFLEAARRAGLDATQCAAVEDSSNGIRSAHKAGMRVIAYPNPHFPPADDALALATWVIDDLDELTPANLRMCLNV